LRTELGLIRKTGYALDPGDGSPDFCCIAAPLPARDGKVGESLALLVPRQRYECERPALVAAVVAMAKVASQMRSNELNAVEGRVADTVPPDPKAALRAAIVAGHHAYLDVAYPRLV
jgi:hypothetical protein